ncbi:MAG: PEP-CTERM sorting domain-containing protein [Chitinophagaceae bacterium]|nr:MAG: PEP-CTERM sorting domain-containing protein [Chitinophagaceae bacterium]
MCVLFSAVQVSASVIDFEDQPHNYFFQNSSIVTGDYNVTHSGSFAMVEGNLGQGATDYSGNGTNRLMSFNESTISITNVLGNAFDLFSFEGGESWIFEPHGWSAKIQVVGTYINGTTTTAFFDLDLIKNPLTGLQLFNLDNSFHDLLKVDFTGIGGNPEFSLDNISVSSGTNVPEPQSLVLLLAGLGLLGFKARTRKV